MTDEEQTITIPLSEAKSAVWAIRAALGYESMAERNIQRCIDEQTYTRPDEPTNLGTVVIADGRVYTRWAACHEHPWIMHDSGTTWNWRHFIRPVVKSHGWDGSDE